MVQEPSSEGYLSEPPWHSPQNRSRMKPRTSAPIASTRVALRLVMKITWNIQEDGTYKASKIRGKFGMWHLQRGSRTEPYHFEAQTFFCFYGTDIRCKWRGFERQNSEFSRWLGSWTTILYALASSTQKKMDVVLHMAVLVGQSSHPARLSTARLLIGVRWRRATRCRSSLG